MARPPGIWRRTSNGKYYFQRGDKQFLLGRTLSEAVKEYARVLSPEGAEEARADFIVKMLQQISTELGGWEVLKEVVDTLKQDDKTGSNREILRPANGRLF